MSKVEPRPTRRFVFKWNPHPNMLVITKREGESRKAKWVGLSDVVGHKVDVGPSRPVVEHLNTHISGRVGLLDGSGPSLASGPIDKPEPEVDFLHNTFTPLDFQQSEDSLEASSFADLPYAVS